MNQFRGLRALAWAYLLETWRSKPALFWNLALPLFFVVGLAYIFGGGETVRVTRIVPGILTINLLSMSFFGVSLHMVSLREQELYRRFSVTPLTSLTVVLAHAVTALVNILISTVLQFVVASLLFHIEIHSTSAELMLTILLAAFAFIPLGLLVGSVAQDMKTAPVISNLLFFPMMFLSGATIPLYLMPEWLQRLAALLPSTYVVEILQAAILHGNAFERLAGPAGILILTGIMGLVYNAMLFRWESREPINRRGLVLAVVSLAIVYGLAFASHIRLESARPPESQGQPATTQKVSAHARILTGMTILDGLGGRIERGRLILDGDRIVEVGAEGGSMPEGVPVTDLTGLYLVPGLIDSHIHIGGSAGGSVSSDEYMPTRVIHDLQVYLAMGVTSFVSMTDHVEDLQRLRKAVAAGTMRAPRPFFSGPGLTAPGGHPAKFFTFLPGLAAYMTRQVDSSQVATAVVRELAAMRTDLVKLFLEDGWLGDSLPVLPEPALRAAIRTAQELGLLTTVHVDNDRHARLAIDAGVRGLEHVPPDLSNETIAAMVAKGVTLTPTLVASEGLAQTLTGEPITDPLVLKWVDPTVLDSLQATDSWIAPLRKSPDAVAYYTRRHTLALHAAHRAAEAGVKLLAGSDAGNPASFHGLGLIRELELLVDEGGMKPAAAIVAATGAAAQRLGIAEIGQVAPGAFADLVVLGSDPSRDIRALRDVRAVYFGGVPIQRETLLSTSPGNWTPLFSWPDPAQPGQRQ